MSFTIVISATVDTNILIYAVDVDSGAKHLISKRIVDSLGTNAGILPLQCLSEFYRATTRKQLIPSADAASIVQQFHAAMRTVPSSFEDLATAMQLHQQHGIQFFDALLIATAQRAGCTIFFSEDFQDGRDFGSTIVRNPFLLAQ
jgi:predicted nucleic acid-binding protein